MGLDGIEPSASALSVLCPLLTDVSLTLRRRGHVIPPTALCASNVPHRKSPSSLGSLSVCGENRRCRCHQKETAQPGAKGMSNKRPRTVVTPSDVTQALGVPNDAD